MSARLGRRLLAAARRPQAAYAAATVGRAGIPVVRANTTGGTNGGDPPAAWPLPGAVSGRRQAGDGGSRWSLSGWILWRPESGPPSLAGTGQLGGSQAGMRLGYRLVGDEDRSLGLNLRLSRPLRGAGGGEAALGLAVRPFEELPLEILAERRIGLERGGRDAWALGIAGGFHESELPLGLELDGWAQAGIVGARSRDLYAEGAISLRRPVMRAGRARMFFGAGSWASAQPGASRVDIGPEASLWFPAGDGAMRLSVGWRQRIAGDAAPDSGPSVTLGADF